MKLFIGVFCLAATWFAHSASAQQISFDIYDIRIGDTPEQVDDAMATASFSLKETLFGDKEYQRSFHDQRQIRLGHSQSAEKNTVKKAMYESDRGLVAVHFTAWPDGASVTDVFFYPESNFLDCDGFKAAASEKFGHGIQVTDGWTDTEGEPDGSITVWAKCGSYSFSPTLHLFMRNARKIHTDLLSATDPEPKLDF